LIGLLKRNLWQREAPSDCSQLIDVGYWSSQIPNFELIGDRYDLHVHESR